MGCGVGKGKVIVVVIVVVVCRAGIRWEKETGNGTGRTIVVGIDPSPPFGVLAWSTPRRPRRIVMMLRRGGNAVIKPPRGRARRRLTREIQRIIRARKS